MMGARAGTIVLLGAVLLVGGAASAGEGEEGSPPDNLFSPSLLERDTLTGGWFGLGEVLEEYGLSVGLGVTQIYQQNVRGGLSTHRRSGRCAGSYDLELELDLEKAINLEGASLYALAEGSWSEGVDPASVGSLFGVNADAAGDRSIDLTQLYFQQDLLGGKVRVRLGKLDLTGGFECRGCPVAFDGNSFANDETAQFLNGALVNNPTIPFPDCGLGLILYLEPVEGYYLSAGIADADADARETGFNTAFSDPDDYFLICEAGAVLNLPSPNGSLPGAYRLGLWHEHRDKPHFSGADEKENDVGYYLSLDQVLWRERGGEEEQPQGLGLFARLGWADEKVNEIKFFWSLGLQYRGFLPGRDDDVLGVGFAQGRLSTAEGAGFSADDETVLELYYNCQLAPWLSISPDLQVVFNPGGDAAVDDAWVVGCRVQLNL